MKKITKQLNNAFGHYLVFTVLDTKTISVELFKPRDPTDISAEPTLIEHTKVQCPTTIDVDFIKYAIKRGKDMAADAIKDIAECKRISDMLESTVESD